MLSYATDSYCMKHIFRLLFLLLPVISYSQSMITGTVRDAATSAPLTSATLHVSGTFRGTVTNPDGRFELTIPSYPAVIVIRYIGYDTDSVRLEREPERPLSVQLNPAEYKLREIIVTGDDPALDIMRRVISNKRRWRGNLQSYQAEAYTRQRLENDTSIVSISESLSDAYWDKNRGTREVIRYKNQTSNIDPSSNFAAATFIPNLYDDNITISGFELVGPTHPDALDFYHFKLDGFRQQDDKTVFDILISPKRALQPTFVGRISVLDEDFAMIFIDVKPSESVMFPPPIQEFGLHYIQQFSNFGSEFWLPVDVRIEGTIKIGFPGLQFPPFNFRQLSRLDNYQVNLGIPDIFFETSRRLTVDSLSVSKGIENPRIGMAIPLDEREQVAYDSVDSTMTIEKAFRPTGALARLIEINEGDSERKPKGPIAKAFDGFSPDVHANRVEGFHLGATYQVPTFTLPVNVKLGGGYATGPGSAFYSLNLERKQRGTFLWHTAYSYGIESRYRESAYPQFMTSVLPLIGQPDYHDHFVSEMVKAGMSYEIVRARREGRRSDDIRMWRRFRVGVSLTQERASSIAKTTNYSLPGGTLQRPNPAITDGTFRSIGFQLNTTGDSAPFGIVGQRAFDLDIEHSARYSRFHGKLEYRIETFLKRRFLPNVLDVSVIVGSALGSLPVQRQHQLDGSLGLFNPFGQLKTLRSAAYDAKHVAAIHWEHNFRTVPFEWIGWDSAAKKGVGLIVFGSSARTWAVDRTHHEIGASINSLFGFLRVDVAYRLDKPSYFAGFSLARIL